MYRKITIYDKAMYFIDATIPEEKAINKALEWWNAREPEIETKILAPCEMGIKCPYDHSCSKCK